MCRALIVVVSAFLPFFISSCSNAAGRKTNAVLNDSIPGDTSLVKDSLLKPVQTIHYPDSSADTNLILREGSVSIYSIGNADCRFNYDWVVKLKDGGFKYSKLLEDNMVDLNLDFDSISIQERQINGKGNMEVVIQYALEGHHLYGGDIMGLGDEEDGGWSYNYRNVEIWDVDKMNLLFHCSPYAETWSKESINDKSDFSFYRYDFNFTQNNTIVLDHLMKEVKDKIVPSKSQMADVRMGTYQFMNESFTWVSAKNK